MVAVLLVALRFVWLPVHLAHEHHEHGPVEHAALVVELDGAHDHGGERHGHGHDQHTSVDPASEWIARKAPLGVELLWLAPVADYVVAVAPRILRSETCDSTQVPVPPPPRRTRARAPPAA
ncbi:MAG: hypothetical protein IPJ77_08220 [Planctomycetes bacterium]|nr:hypothetical protein [Planctomycetota bacterium]